LDGKFEPSLATIMNRDFRLGLHQRPAAPDAEHAHGPAERYAPLMALLGGARPKEIHAFRHSPSLDVIVVVVIIGVVAGLSSRTQSGGEIVGRTGRQRYYNARTALGQYETAANADVFDGTSENHTRGR
jgi:hypothetical protein